MQSSKIITIGCRGLLSAALQATPDPYVIDMKNSQITKGQASRLMYVENKEGTIDGVPARIGWVKFSKTGRTIYYRGKFLQVAKGGGVRGNFFDTETGEEYWVSGVKKRGSNAHCAEPVVPVVDDDAREEYDRLRGGL